MNAEHKGAYTYRDLNRVEEAVEYVAMMLQENSYFVEAPQTRRWSVADKPNETDFKRYLDNIALLRNAAPVFKTTPQVPQSVDGLDVHTANDIEKILLDIERVINGIIESWFFLDEMYSSEV